LRPYEERILRALRRITRALDLHSRQLAGSFGLTGPQLVCLRALDALGPLTPSQLARHVDLSQATVTGIIDRLEASGLVARARNVDDRRRVTVRLTDEGNELVKKAPSPLQDRFLAQLAGLPEDEQEQLLAALTRVVAMMGVEALEAVPPDAAGLEEEAATVPATARG
jgi:DNA-binding MarR family transcriptional regulator